MKCKCGTHTKFLTVINLGVTSPNKLRREIGQDRNLATQKSTVRAKLFPAKRLRMEFSFIYSKAMTFCYNVQFFIYIFFLPLVLLTFNWHYDAEYFPSRSDRQTAVVPKLYTSIR
jgi:hypothetical protein